MLNFLNSLSHTHKSVTPFLTSNSGGVRQILRVLSILGWYQWSEMAFLLKKHFSGKKKK